MFSVYTYVHTYVHTPVHVSKPIAVTDMHPLERYAPCLILYQRECISDYGLRTSLAEEVEGEMSIVTQLPDVSAQSRSFISGRSKVHGRVTDIHKRGGGMAGKKRGQEVAADFIG